MPGLNRQRRNLLLAGTLAALALAWAAVLPRALIRADSQEEPELASTADSTVTVEADYSQEWTDGRDQIALLRGRCRIIQGETVLSADKMVVWRRTDENGTPRDRLLVYLEDRVRLEQPGQSLSEASMLVNLATNEGVTFAALRRMTDSPGLDDVLFQRADKRRQRSQRASLQPTQLVVPPAPGSGPAIPGVQIAPTPTGTRRIRIFPRSLVSPTIESFPSTETTPPEQVTVITGGVNILIDGVERFGTVDLAADRMVIWSESMDEIRSETVQSSETRLTIYLEGNIIIRQGTHVIEASRAVYDAREDRALVLDAELRTFIPAIQDDIRLRAQYLRQLSQDSFYAQNAWVTASDFGKPGYRLQASEVFLEQRYIQPLFGPGGQFDPVTGAPLVEQVPWVTSLDNTVYIEDVPILYLPRISGPAEDPQIPIRRASAGYDRIFGFQVRTVWDMSQLLGIDEPPGVRWDLMLDYLSDRGPAVGTGGIYGGTDLFGIPGVYEGAGLAYYIHDTGEDVLGNDRLGIPPEQENRYLAQLRHRQRMPYNLELIAELGLVSDRNFLEQYFEPEWDTGKDVETLLYLKQQFNDTAWTALLQPQVNDFYTVTEWLPRGDFYLLGEPLFDGALTYYTHSEAAYAQLRPGVPPETAFDPFFEPVPYWAPVEGEILMTRHELDAPFNLGPAKIVPYALGEAAHWGEGFDGEPVDRLMGSLGIRSSLMFWRVFPYVQSRIFNLNGLAHKVLWEAEYAYTETTEDLKNIPQYHEIDDNAQQRFRTRYLDYLYRGGGPGFPPPFDPRFYAVRTGAGRSVSDPYYELVDDQEVVRLALRQRLQTKVGPPERLRIKDWMTLDLQASFFPEEARDNFGEDVGLLSARYLWNVGDRTSIFAGALYDVFDEGQELWDLGFMTQRGPRGRLSASLHQIKGGPLHSRIVTASYSYQMSPKWMSTAGTAYDLGENRDLGQMLSVTRIGADFLFHVAANYDPNKDNAGFGVVVEPRIGNLIASPNLMGSLLGGDQGRRTP